MWTLDFHLDTRIVIRLYLPSSLSVLISVFLPCFLFTKKFWIKVKTYIQGDDEHCIIWCELLSFFFFPQCSFFCLFHFSSCLVPPLWCSLYWNSNGSHVCVCVWPARTVIEPICRLAPVGLNPGLTALRWLNAFAMFLKLFLVFFLPTSVDIPPLNLFHCVNKFFIETDALSFHWVGDPQESILHILCCAAWHSRFISWGGKKAL